MRIMVDITAKQMRIAELKSQGLKNKEIAAIEYPEAHGHAGDVIVSRELKKPHVAQYVDKGREIALKRYSVTWDTMIAKLTVMLNADKTDNLTGQIKPDYITQMNAIKLLIPLLEKKLEQPRIITDDSALQTVLNSGDEVELVKATFRKSAPSWHLNKPKLEA